MDERKHTSIYLFHYWQNARTNLTENEFELQHWVILVS